MTENKNVPLKIMVKKALLKTKITGLSSGKEKSLFLCCISERDCLSFPSKRGCSYVWQYCSKRRHKVRVSIPKPNPISEVTICHHAADTNLHAFIPRLRASLVRKVQVVVSSSRRRRRKEGKENTEPRISVNDSPIRTHGSAAALRFGPF